MGLYTSRILIVHCSTGRLQAPLATRIAPALLAATVLLSGTGAALDAAFPAPARADEDQAMSSYQRRQAEMERRRELLREA